MDTQNGESRPGEGGSLGGAGVNRGCGGLNLFGKIRPLGRIKQAPPRENPSPPPEFTPGQRPWTLDNRHPGAALALRALYREPWGEWPGGVPRLAKLIKVGANPKEIEHYDDSFLHEAYGLDVSSRERLLNTVTFLQDKPHTCLVFGALSDEATPASMRRLKKDTIDKKGRLWKATIIDARKDWLAIDLDGLPIPLGVHGLRRIAEYVRSRLPPEFRDVWCVVSATGSYAIKTDGVHLRFFFWLDRPLTCAEKRCWLRKAPYIDCSIYTPNQPIYTSGPVFEGDAEYDDPLFGISRVITLDGAEHVVTPHAERLKPPPRPFYQEPCAIELKGKGCAMLSAACMAIRAMNKPMSPDEAPRPPRHEVIFNQCRDIVKLVAMGCLDEEYALLRITRASADIGKTDENEIKRIFNDTLRYRRERMEMENGNHGVFDENDEEVSS